jgi:hypothetical protein
VKIYWTFFYNVKKNCDFGRNRCSEGHTSHDSIKQTLHALSKFLSIAKNSIEVISTTTDLLIVSFVQIGEVEIILYWKTYINISAYLALIFFRFVWSRVMVSAHKAVEHS